MRPILSAALGLVAWLAAAAGASAATTDDAFLTRAIEVDLAAVALGQLAQSKGGTEEVRAFGALLVRDHTASRKEAMELAVGIGAPSASTPSAEDQQAFSRLRELDGAAFDTALARQVVTAHEATIALFEAKAGEGDGKVSEFAERSLPTLKRHVEIARSLLGETDSAALPEAGPGEQPALVAPGPADAGTEGFAEGLRQEELERNAAAESAPTGSVAGPISSQELLGASVYGPGGDSLGTVADVLLRDVGPAGEVEAVIVDVGGFLGIGAKPVVLAFDSLTLARAGDGLRVTTAVTREQLDAAPPYDAAGYARDRGAAAPPPG